MWHRPGASNLGKVRFAMDAPKPHAALTPPRRLPTSQKGLTRCSWGPSLHPSNSLSLFLSSTLPPPSALLLLWALVFPLRKRGLLCPDEGGKNPKCRFYFRARECTWWQVYNVANSYLLVFFFLKVADHLKLKVVSLFTINHGGFIGSPPKKLQADGKRSCFTLSLAS